MNDGNLNVDKSDSSSFEDLPGASDFADDDMEHLEKEEKEEEEWLDVLGSGQLMKKIIKKGISDVKPQRNDICRIRYEGRLRSNGQVIETQDDLNVQLGDADVIQGLDLILPLMEDGEQCLVKIPPRFGFGEAGCPAPQVPPNADLEYTLELISSQPEPEMETLSYKERKTIGNKKRERGNWWYSMQEPALAVQCYRRAVDFLDESRGGITDPTPDGGLESTAEELHELLTERLKVYNNMAAAQMRLQSYDAALKSVDTVLSCQPDNLKALMRKGKILSHKGDIAGALAAMRSAQALSPESAFIRGELTRLEGLSRQDGQRERELARRMMGGSAPASAAQPADKDKEPSKSNKMFLWGSVLVSIAIGVLSYAIYRLNNMDNSN